MHLRHHGIDKSCTGKYDYAYRDEGGRLRFKTAALVDEKPNLRQAVAEREETMAASAAASPTRRRRRPCRLRRAGYRYQLHTHLLPRFGTRKLAEVDLRVTADEVTASACELPLQVAVTWEVERA